MMGGVNFLKRILSIPPEEERKRGDSWLARQSIIPAGLITDPDIYIFYRAGYIINVMTLTLGICAYIISYLHYAYGVFPSLVVYARYPDMLGVTACLFGKICGILFLVISYYFALFSLHVDFRKWNLLKRGPYKSARTIPGKKLLLILSSPFLMWIILTAFEHGIGWFHIYPGTFEEFYNNPVFVGLLSVFMTLGICGAAALFFMLYLLVAFIIYEFLRNCHHQSKKGDIDEH